MLEAQIWDRELSGIECVDHRVRNEGHIVGRSNV